MFAIPIEEWTNETRVKRGKGIHWDWDREIQNEI